MTDIMWDGPMNGGLGAPRIVDRSAFQAELDALRLCEKARVKAGYSDDLGTGGR